MGIPRRMRAVFLTGFGGPEKLVESTTEIPEPGAGEVLVSVSACGINNTDIWLREGGYAGENNSAAATNWRGKPPSFPIIQGSDIVGRVVKVGPGGDSSLNVKRVLVNPVLYPDRAENLTEAGFLGSERNGGFAEFVTVPAANVHPVNSSLKDTELATFPCAYLTAEHMLNRAGVGAGELVVITGASGGVGSALIQLLVIRKSEVLAVVGRGKEDRAAGLGAHWVVNHQKDGLYEAITKTLNDRDVDVVADVVGGEMFPALLRLLKPGGRYVIAGAIAGPRVEIDLRSVYLKHREIIGSSLGTMSEFKQIVHYIESNQLKPLLYRSFPLSAINQAQQEFKAKKFFGKLVISI